MEHQRPGGLDHLVVWLGCVILLAVADSGHSQTRGAPVGAEAIKGMLTGHKQWTFYWDRHPVSSPRLASKASEHSPRATFEFLRIGPRVIGHAYDDRVHYAECEFDVTVREDGFIFAGCWGSDKSMTYDPDDREYPFKGRVEGTLLWLAPHD